MAKPREDTRKPAAKSRPVLPDVSVRDLSPDHSEIELAALIGYRPEADARKQVQVAGERTLFREVL